MIATITLNAAIDKTYWITGFTPGVVHRTRRMKATPGGKGLNVARILQKIGEEAIAAGFVGGFNGQYILQQLMLLGVSHDFVQVNGESRICLNVIDDLHDGLTSTEILEQGLTITNEDITRMEATVRQLAGRARIVAFSGSLPMGAPADLYATLIRICKEQGALTFLDSSGEALRHGIAASPTFIKPNEHEVGAILGMTHPSEDDINEGIRTLMDRGIRTVVVTKGAGGSIAGHDGQLYKIVAPHIQPVNTVGCGDAFVAAMAAAELDASATIEQRLAYATAVASASALTEETGDVRLADIHSLLPHVIVSP